MTTNSTNNVASAHNSDSVRLTSQEDKTMTNEEHEAAEDLVERWLRGYLEGTSKANQRWVPIIKQLCRDLNEAHNEILRQQGVAESDYGKYDWPEWTPQANSIRWAERETKERLAKTDSWTLYPAAPTPLSSEGKTGEVK